jgi:polysaccharide export outer membrane protein
MQNRTTNPIRVSHSLVAATAGKHWTRRALQMCFAIALCAGLQIRGAALQQNDVATTTTDSTASPDQTNPPANPPSASVPPDDTFIIGPDDVLGINVWKEPELTRAVPVRSDGKISLPLIGDIQAAGRTPMQLQEDIAAKLRGYITDPQVTVIVQQILSQKFNILGQISKPGSYPLSAGTTIVDAIALAGGFKDFAKKKGVYILRLNSAGKEERFNFNYDKFLKEKNTAQNIKLKPHDTIVVP